MANKVVIVKSGEFELTKSFTKEDSQTIVKRVGMKV